MNQQYKKNIMFGKQAIFMGVEDCDLGLLVLLPLRGLR
jgi:hypothetical protein